MGIVMKDDLCLNWFANGKEVGYQMPNKVVYKQMVFSVKYYSFAVSFECPHLLSFTFETVDGPQITVKQTCSVHISSGVCFVR